MVEDATNQPSDTTPFHQRFNIQVGRGEVEKRFVNRVENRIQNDFPGLRYGVSSHSSDEEALLNVANRLGKEYYSFYGFSEYVGKDIYSCLQAVEALYDSFVTTSYSGDIGKLTSVIQDAIVLSETDLGIRWQGGLFLPSGAKLLDEALVNENLKWLADAKYVNVLAPFEKGLRHFLEAHRNPERLADAVTDMYEALEAMAKVITGKDRDLSANREAFLSKLKLSDYYKKMLRDYIDYANQYRHGIEEGVERKPPLLNEVEAFMYTTGLFIRLSIQSLATA